MRRPILALATLAMAGSALAQPPQPPADTIRQCGICHDRHEFKTVQPDGSVRSLFVDRQLLQRSVHARWQCLDCHTDIASIPHPRRLAPVDCQRCHFPGNPVGAPEDVNYEGYTRSVHGKLHAEGNPRAPLCQDCHGTHLILAAAATASRVNKLNVPETCGACHERIRDEFRRSVHGIELLEHDNLDAPSCIDCHGEHDILPPKEDASEVSATHIPETCSQCHGALEFNQRYGISVNPVQTFQHSFHGIASSFGSKRVANCASCHTAHDVLPRDDPRSSVNPVNVARTCGKQECHPGANANYARGRFHVDPTSREAGVIYWVALFFKILTISTMVGLGIHILLDLTKKLRHRREGGQA